MLKYIFVVDFILHYYSTIVLYRNVFLHILYYTVLWHLFLFCLYSSITYETA